jgi:predicted small lipoprotein YifL
MKQISFKTLKNGLAQVLKGVLSVGSISAVILLSACGQRGPLYHPEPPPPLGKSNSEAQQDKSQSSTPSTIQKSTKQ